MATKISSLIYFSIEELFAENFSKLLTKNTDPDFSKVCIYSLPKTGIEPVRPEGHGILSPGRLPIPPLGPA